MTAVDVAIVGGGTAGLALATELKHLGVANVVVLERENQAGGVPRHCGHYPFGLREFKRVMKGPDYARKLVAKARSAGVDIRTNTTVTALHPQGSLSIASPEGLTCLQAKRVVLCTGVRESSRAQRFISGQRPLGVIATGALQSMVYLHKQRPFKRPVIIGTELVSFSSIMTCRHMGMRPQAMIEENNAITVRQFMRPYPALMGVPLHLNAQDLYIHGDKQVTSVSFSSPKGPTQIACDGVIISGQFRPEAALLHASHLEIDPATGGPSIDQYGRTTDPSYFVTGNLLRPVETSSWCWHEAVETAARVAYDLSRPLQANLGRALRAADPDIRYVVPQRLIQSTAPNPMQEMQIRLNKPASGHLVMTADNRPIWTDFLQSRPERRLFAPTAPAINAKGASRYGLHIERR